MERRAGLIAPGSFHPVSHTLQGTMTTPETENPQHATLDARLANPDNSAGYS